MNPKNHTDETLEGLLRAALADDLPDDVAAGMRDRIAVFRAGMTKEGMSPQAMAWLFRRGLWATLAVLFLVAGFLLQGLKVRNPLADRIALIKAEITRSAPARASDINSENRTIAPEKRPVLIPDEKEA